jgi:hypothetical protein
MKLTTISISYRFITLITTASIASSCSSGFRPESIDQKMDRFQAQNIGQNIVPDSFVNHELLIKNISRGPASVSVKKNKKNNLPYNNKKLYFLTLLDQYNYLKTYSKNQNNPTLEICPKFHSLLIRHGEEYSVNSYNPKSWSIASYDSAKFSDKNYLANHPELTLPVSSGNARPAVIDLLKKVDSQKQVKEIIYGAFDLHLSKTYSEIKELCEYGNSNNYYTYENLNTLAKKSSFTKNSQSLNTLLRTTIFSNLALKSSLDKNSSNTPARGIASERSNFLKLENEVIERLGVNWSNDYFKSL